MKVIKDILLKRGLTTAFVAASLVCTIITLIIYNNTGVNDFYPQLNDSVISLYVWGIVIGVLMCAVEVKTGKYVLFMILLAGWLTFITSQINYVTNVFVSIDGTSFSAGFIMTIVFGVLASAFALVSAILQKNEIGCGSAKKAVKAEESNEQ